MLRETQYQPSDLVLADRQEAIQPVRREYLDGADAAEVPPVVPIRRGDHGCAVVRYVFGHDEIRPVRQHDVVLRETFLGDRIGGDDEDEAVAEAEGEDRRAAEGFGEGEEIAVERRLEAVEMADHRQGVRRSRREVGFPPEFSEKEIEREEEEEE